MGTVFSIPREPLLPWLQDGRCQVCGGRKVDLRAPWSLDEVRSHVVYSTGDRSCRSAALATALHHVLLDNAWNDAHRGCAVSCLCGHLVHALRLVGGLLIPSLGQCLICPCGERIIHQPPVPRLALGRPKFKGVTWCGHGAPCQEDCPLP